MIFISAVGVHSVAPGGKINRITSPDPKMRIIMTLMVMRIETGFLMGSSRHFDYRSK
jgi:hypothetical protein